MAFLITLGQSLGAFFFLTHPPLLFLNDGTIIDGTKNFGSHLFCLLWDFEVESGQAPPPFSQRKGQRLKEEEVLPFHM